MIDNLYAKHKRMLDGMQSLFRRDFHEAMHWDERMTGITGARGVGKTTLILQRIREQESDGRSHLYVSLDDISFPYENLVELADAFEKRGGEYLYIDEIHKYRNWSQELKNIYDLYPKLKVVFTGSSMLDIAKGKADLSRRAVAKRMQGLSFREFLNIETGSSHKGYSLEDILQHHETISREIVKEVKPLQYFNQYLNFGYYPYYLQSRDTYHHKLGNTISLTVESDLATMYGINIQYIEKIKRFLNLLSTNIPFKPNVSRLASAIGVSWTSVIQYLRYLDEAEIIRILYHEGKHTRVMSKPEMIYLHHPNLFFVFHQNVENKGNIRESFFLNQVGYQHQIEKGVKGDFVVSDKYTFEVGGKNKTYHQVAGLQNAFIAADDTEYGFGCKIPLWLFGFLY